MIIAKNTLFVLVLLYASYYDYKHRIIPDKVHIIILVLGLININIVDSILGLILIPLPVLIIGLTKGGIDDEIFNICNCKAIIEKRSRLFRLAISINEAYILKYKDIIVSNLNKILVSGKASMFTKYYRSTYIYNDKTTQNLKALWETFNMCYPIISTTFHSYEKGKYHMINELFDLLLVDEAGQVFPHYLVGPLYRSKRAIIVGDVLQLQPIRKKKYPSIFENHQNNIEDIHNLDAQSAQNIADVNSDSYEILNNSRIGVLLEEHRRCERNIVEFSNKYVYDGKMKIVKENKEKSIFKSNLVFLDVRGVNIKLSNSAEIDASEGLVNELLKHHLPKDIGIITPYGNHKNNLKQRFNDIGVECGTVHAFQGKGKKIIIINLVVSSLSDKRGINFIGSEPNFLNVALTRAIDQLIIIGNYDILEKSGDNHLKNLSEVISGKGKIYSIYRELDESIDLESLLQYKKIISHKVVKDSEYHNLFNNFEVSAGLLSNDSHFLLLHDLLNTANSIEICTPWVTRVVMKDEFLDKINNYISNQKKMKIFFGFHKTKHSLASDEGIAAIIKRDSAFKIDIEKETEMIKNLKGMLGDDLVYRPPLHSKFVIVNDKYLIIGSHNWLSKQGQKKGSREELSCILTDKSMIQYIRSEIL